MKERNYTEKTRVLLTYTNCSDLIANKQETLKTVIKDTEGGIVYLQPPSEKADFETLIVDPEDEVWARYSTNEETYWGKNARIEPVNN